MDQPSIGAPDNRELDAGIPEADRKARLAPITYIVKLHGPLAKALESYAKSERSTADVIIKEAVRTFIGDAIR